MYVSQLCFHLTFLGITPSMPEPVVGRAAPGGALPSLGRPVLRGRAARVRTRTGVGLAVLTPEHRRACAPRGAPPRRRPAHSDRPRPSSVGGPCQARPWPSVRLGAASRADESAVVSPVVEGACERLLPPVWWLARSDVRVHGDAQDF